MTHGQPAPPVTIFTGRFGSGKTEAAIGYAQHLARRAAGREPGDDGALPVALIDLDIVTPYFRSREAADLLGSQGVQVIAPSVIGQHLDTPALTPAILGAIQRPDQRTVLDVGGDRQGARALGSYSAAIERRGYVMHFVVNPYRPFTDTPAGLRGSIEEIQASARLRVTSLVSNPNLMAETTAEAIAAGHQRVVEFARQVDLPVAWLCLERRWLGQLGANHFEHPVLVLDRFLVRTWE